MKLMRTQHLLAFCLLGLLTLAGCNTSIVEKRATGLPYEVLVVMDKTDWNSEAGDMVKAQLTSPDSPSRKPPCVSPSPRKKRSMVC